MTSVASALADVTARITAAAAHANREPAGVRLLPITKTIPARRLPERQAAGLSRHCPGSGLHAYRSRPADCAACGLKPQCTIAKQRAVSRLITEDGCDQVRALSGTEASIGARQRRKRIKRVFGHLKCNLNLRFWKLGGLNSASGEFTMAAAAYNLQLLATRAAPA